MYHRLLDEAMMRVLPDQPADMARMLGLGVDGLVTNSPRLLRATLQAALQQCVATSAPTGCDLR